MELPEFYELEHTADWALQINGASLSHLFHNATLGMFDLMGVKLADDGGLDRKIDLEAFDLEELLVAWLEELLYGVEMRSVGVTNLELAVEENSSLISKFTEVPISSIEKEIKGVTFHGLEIKGTRGSLEAIVVFDV